MSEKPPFSVEDITKQIPEHTKNYQSGELIDVSNAESRMRQDFNYFMDNGDLAGWKTFCESLVKASTTGDKNGVIEDLEIVYGKGADGKSGTADDIPTVVRMKNSEWNLLDPKHKIFDLSKEKINRNWNQLVRTYLEASKKK